MRREREDENWYEEVAGVMRAVEGVREGEERERGGTLSQGAKAAHSSHRSTPLAQGLR